LSQIVYAGGRQPYRLPVAALPSLPAADEVATAPPSARDAATSVFSAIDPRFDPHLAGLLQQADKEPMVLCTSALSRYSRNSAKLHRVLEFLLAHDATIGTTNYLIRPGDVWVRRSELVKPNSRDPYASPSPVGYREPTASWPKPPWRSAAPPSAGDPTASPGSPSMGIFACRPRSVIAAASRPAIGYSWLPSLQPASWPCARRPSWTGCWRSPLPRRRR
jgi:hypothetical protein